MSGGRPPDAELYHICGAVILSLVSSSQTVSMQRRRGFDRETHSGRSLYAIPCAVEIIFRATTLFYLCRLALALQSEHHYDTRAKIYYLLLIHALDSLFFSSYSIF